MWATLEAAVATRKRKATAGALTALVMILMAFFLLVLGGPGSCESDPTRTLDDQPPITTGATPTSAQSPQSQVTTTTATSTTSSVSLVTTTTIPQSNDLFTGVWVFEWTDPASGRSEGTMPGKYQLVPGEDRYVGTVTVLDAENASPYKAVYYFEFPSLTMTFTEVLPDGSGLVTIFHCDLTSENILTGWVESEPVTILESEDGTTTVQRSGKLERLKWDILGRMVDG